MSFKEILDYIRAEGQVIKDAPVAFCGFLVIFGFLVFGVADWHYSGQLAGKDAAEAAKQGQIDFLTAKLDDAQKDNSQLRSENEQLREDAGKAPLLGTTTTNASPAKIIDWEPPLLTNEAVIAIVEIGQGGSAAQFGVKKGLSYETPVYDWAGHHAVVAKILNDKIFVNLNVPTGKLPIEIRDGKSTPLPDGWDWNCDSNALEIVDERGEAVLQEQYLSPGRVRIDGEIQIGDQIFVTPSGNNFFPQSFTPGMFHPENISLVTMFEYPSASHMGERIP